MFTFNADYDNEELLAAVSEDEDVPVTGQYAEVDYDLNADDSKWLECDGSLVSRTTYATLFAKISTIHGAGDGSTTFALPNRAGRVSVGAGTGYTVGTKGGEKTKTLSVANMPTHSHNFQMNNDDADSSFPSANSVFGNVAPAGTSIYNTESPSVQNTAVIASEGNGTSFNIEQPYVVSRFFIYSG